MPRMLMLIPLVSVVLACAQVAPSVDPPTEVVATPAISEVVVTPVAPTEEPAPTEAPPTPPPPPTTGGGQPPSATGELALPLYAGDSLIEEKIIRSSTVVRATMTSFSSEVVVEPDGKYAPVLKFNLNVSEYLKGTGPSSIVAVWVDGRSYDSNAEANDAKVTVLAERDGRWDDREAIIFLYGAGSGLGASLDAQLQLADHFLLYVGDPYSPDDFYSLHSRQNKRWLPAATSTGSTGDGQEFLLDVPPPTETITLGDLKRRITEVAAELDGGDGSELYRECVLKKYRHLRNQRNWPEDRGEPYSIWDLDHSLVSGQPAGAVLDRRESGSDEYPDDSRTITLWLEGRDSVLFDTAEGDSTVSDTDGDGEYDMIRYDELVRLARPLPAGEYRFDLKESWPIFAICNFVISNEWTVTVTSPAGVMHELLFDPVTVGSSIAADDTNGVLKPASFTVADGSSATIERISYEPPSSDSGQAGTVKIAITAGSDPDDLLGEHLLDFIELDGTVSLSLYVAAATVDTANDTLSWTAASQPWDDGDKLMVRIRRNPTSRSGGVAVPAPTATPATIATTQPTPAPQSAFTPTPASVPTPTAAPVTTTTLEPLATPAPNSTQTAKTAPAPTYLTIRTANYNNRATSTSTDPAVARREGCGHVYACFKPYSFEGSNSEHLGEAELVFEDPPWLAARHPYRRGEWLDIEFQWTAVSGLNNTEVPCNELPAICATMDKRFFAYIGSAMRHEFGHTLGLDEFYDDPRLKHLDAAMNVGNVVTDEDIAQLEAIYFHHSPH